tara:strand:+ start:594 stop:1487 length:894 start_codon:yes stop_codon:yes gene_type:complete
MKCIVTGGAGFIGSTLVDTLIKEGHEVAIFDNLSTGFEENINPQATFHKLDIANKYDYASKYFSNIDIIFHMACLARVQPSIENPRRYHDTNVNGTLNLLEMARTYKIKRFVFSSSSSVYGDAKSLPTDEKAELNPKSPYALHKIIGEQYCKLYSELYGLETISLRYFNVYGDRQPLRGAYCLVTGIFLQQKLDGLPMTIRGDGTQRRDFTYVEDVVSANIKAGFSKIKWDGDIFNIGNGNNRSVNELADMLGGDKVYIDPVIEPKETLANISKAKGLLGWEPTTDINDWIKKYNVE